jgi:hypothetical protein
MVDFGFLTFLHEADYWERSERGDIPVGLTLLMAANALRYVLYHGLISKPVSYFSAFIVSHHRHYVKGFSIPLAIRIRDFK